MTMDIAAAQDLAEAMSRASAERWAQWRAAASGVLTNADDERWNRLMARQAAEEAAESGPSSWEPLDLTAVLDVAYSPPTPTVLTFHDFDGALFYPAAVNLIHGDSGTGKSWVALHAAAQELNAGHPVTIVDLESNAAEVVDRLRALGVTDARIMAQLDYVRPDEPAGAVRIIPILERLTERGDTLVVVDSVGEALALWSFDENSDADVTAWSRFFARPLAETGAAVLLVDHATKNGSNPLFPSGSKRKRAAVTGVNYLVTASKPPTKTTPGRLQLKVGKDRHGTYRQGALVANLEVVPDVESVTIRAWSVPDGEHHVDLSQRMIAAALVKWLDQQGRPVSKNQIETAKAVKASAAAIRGALDLARAEGAVTVTEGPRGAQMFAFHHRFEIEP